LKVLSFSYCFPHSAAPQWGVFVSQRLTALAKRTELQVVSPLPSFPGLTRLRGNSGPVLDNDFSMTVHRQPFFCFPGILKSLDGRLYARGLRPWLGQFVDSWRPDILDAHFVWPDGVGVSRLANWLDLPYTITLRGKIYPCLQIPSQRRQCAKALQSAAAVISGDSRMAEMASDLGVSHERIHIIPNGVDMERFCPRDKQAARRELGLPVADRLLVSVAHLGERKGHRETLQALAQLPVDVKLVLVGGDSASHRGGKKQLERLAKSLGIGDRVIFAGSQLYDRVPFYYNAADVSVLASWREGCPNVVLESLASGTPSVASDVGNVPEMIESGHNGKVVPPRQAESLAEAIREVLAQRLDPETVRNSPAVRSWEDVATNVEHVFHEILATRRRERATCTIPSR
jgi:teichuronic acid biosynthesis glycosyltransferase TuaC